MLRMDEIITLQDANHDHAEERFRMADGSGKMWVAFRYDYVRRGAQVSRGVQVGQRAQIK